ncbi:MAG: DUF4352 domain-containing protein [Defluviitaleaceae bacterium]|nr:DUF4352 domain-containing protein [Defluviitaleaceae bacterium]
MKVAKRIAWVLVPLIIVAAIMARHETDNNTPVQRVATPASNQAPSQNATPAESADNTATVGETLERGGIQFTLEKVERYVDRSDFAMDKPASGNEFILLWFAVRNTSNEDYHVNMFYEDSYVDGFSQETKPLFFGVSGDSLWGDVAVGKATRGYVGYEIKTGWNEIEFQYKPIFSGQESKLIFIATSNDVE